MKTLQIIGLLIFACLISEMRAQDMPLLSERAELSVLTCSPGDELYSVFGHSALRVNDPGRLDFVYNYGTFTFTDDFYLQFARGKLNYKLSRSTFAAFNHEYLMTGRGVMEQVLNLDSLQKQQLFSLLEENYLPENRYYLYDFFYDNCATRIRDVVNDALGQDLRYHSNFAADSATFRNMIDMYLVGMPWADFGIDLALGAPCDYKLKAQDNMFLPDFVFSEFASAEVQGSPLVSETREVVTREFVLEEADYSLPTILAAIIALVSMVVLFRATIRRRTTIWWERTILFTLGFLGIAIALLWFATDHQTTRLNYNLVWAFPLHFLVAFFIRKRSKLVAFYFKIFAFVYFAFVITASLWPQEFHPAAYLFGVAALAVSWRIGFTPSGKSA